MALATNRATTPADPKRSFRGEVTSGLVERLSAGASGRLLRRADISEHDQEEKVVRDLQAAGEEKRPAETGGRKQRAREQRAGSRSEAARHRRDAGSRRASSGATTAIT